MSNMNNAVVAQIVNDHLARGEAQWADDLRDGSQVVEVDNDCCLVIHPALNRADFYFRAPLVGGPQWGYRHSYGAPRRPSDARRYLRHGRAAMRQYGWEV